MKRIITFAVAAALGVGACGQDPRPVVCNDAQKALDLVQGEQNWESRSLGEDGNVQAELADDAREIGAEEGCAGFDSDDADDE
jgi:hypothetical protein